MKIEELIKKLQETAVTHPGIAVTVSVDDMTSPIKEVTVYRLGDGKTWGEESFLGLEG